jgi:dienelactone hydrolase
MRVNHLHLMVPDVPAAAAFFEKYFDLKKTGGNAGLTVLLDDSGFVLTLMKRGARSTGSALIALCFFVCADAFGAPRVEEVSFSSHDARLSGSIAYPAGRPLLAAVVFVHGAGKQSRDLALAGRFAGEGIAALVYDKRGVGKSGGEYEGNYNVSEKNLSLLADDAAAALQWLAAQPALKSVPIGVTGFSQGGWIAPLAAERSGKAKFLVLFSGPVCKVSEENIYSAFASDGDLDNVPTFAAALAARKEPAVWPDFLGRDTNSAEDLQRLSIPGLWLFGDRDGSIPVDLSIANLHKLKAAGHRYDYALFSGQGHDNIDATFATAVGWIKRQPRATASMLLPSGSSTNAP